MTGFKKIAKENKEGIAIGIILEKEGLIIECNLISYDDKFSTLIYFIDTEDGENLGQAPDIEEALIIMNKKIGG